MKKLPFIFLFALVVVYLCACGAAGPVVQAAITNPPATETAVQAAPLMAVMALHG